MQVLYTAQATATGGRNGKVESSDGVVKLDLTMPKSLGGAETPGTSNPEQLFASGYAACFAGAVGLVARNAKVEAKTVEVTARVSIGKDDGGRTSTVRTLQRDERVGELARMLAGLGDTDTGRAHAEELLATAQADRAG